MGPINTRRLNMHHRKPTYHGDRDRKRVFEAPGTIFPEVSVQIDPTPFHAQVTGAIVGTPGVQFRGTPYPFDGAVNFSFFFYHLQTAEFDESVTVVLQVMSMTNDHERPGRSIQVARGMDDTNDENHKGTGVGKKANLITPSGGWRKASSSWRLL